jgi:tRNA pseudouridine55 synthase
VASGILNVNKPVGPSSFAVVRVVGRLPGVLKAGHGGALDPAAEGVLPILVNAATRLADFVHLWPKTYLATVAFGATSDTGDRQGTLTPVGDSRQITRERIEAILPSFIGRIAQVPPLYSALKREGEPLYRKARRGEDVERPPRMVEIRSIRLIDYDPEAALARIEVQSGRGMYVRSLAQDLGTALNGGAYLAALTRLTVGPLSLDTAIPMAALGEINDRWLDRLLPMDLPIRDWPAVILSESELAEVRQGRSIMAPRDATGRYRMLGPDGRLVAWGELRERQLQPRAVFMA